MDFLKGSTLRKKLIKFSAREPPLRFVSIATFGEIEGNQDKIKLTPTLPPSKHIGSLGALCTQLQTGSPLNRLSFQSF